MTRRLPRSIAVHTGLGSLTAAVLYVASLQNYLLFHCLAEVFSIVIAGGVFMVAWNSRESSESRHLVYLGIGYLFVAVFDLFHTLSYRGMGVFSQTYDFATKLWIAGPSEAPPVIGPLSAGCCCGSTVRLSRAAVFSAAMAAALDFPSPSRCTPSDRREIS